MKRTVKLFVSLILCLSVILSFASCQYVDGLLKQDSSDEGFNEQGNQATSQPEEYVYGEGEHKHSDCIVPKGYTGGLEFDPCFHEEYGIYWLETYDEVLEAVELLKSNGSTIKRSITFNYQGDLFDVKFCFLYKRHKAEPLEEGKNFFDRKIDEGEFSWYAFYDDVEIEDFLYYSCIYYDYNTMWIEYDGYDRDFINIKNTDILSIDWFGKTDMGYDVPVTEYPNYGYYDILYSGKSYCELHFSETWLPAEYHEELLSTLVVIE